MSHQGTRQACEESRLSEEFIGNLALVSYFIKVIRPTQIIISSICAMSVAAGRVSEVCRSEDY